MTSKPIIQLIGRMPYAEVSEYWQRKQKNDIMRRIAFMYGFDNESSKDGPLNLILKCVFEAANIPYDEDTDFKICVRYFEKESCRFTNFTRIFEVNLPKTDKTKNLSFLELDKAKKEFLLKSLSELDNMPCDNHYTTIGLAWSITLIVAKLAGYFSLSIMDEKTSDLRIMKRQKMENKENIPP